MTDKHTFLARNEQENLVLKNEGPGKAIHKQLAEAADKSRKTLRQPKGESDTMGVQVEGDEPLSGILTGLTYIEIQVRHKVGIVIIEAKIDGNTVYPVERIEPVRQARPGEFSDADALAVLLEEDEVAGITPGTPEVVSGDAVLGENKLEPPKDTEADTPRKLPQKGPPGKLPPKPAEGDNPSDTADGILKRWFNRR